MAKSRKRSVGTNNPRNPKGLSKDELAAERKLRSETKRYAKKKAASDKEKPARYTRKKAAAERAENAPAPTPVESTPLSIDREGRGLPDIVSNLTEEQRNAMLNSDSKTSPRRGEEEGTRQEYIKGREERDLAEIGSGSDLDTPARLEANAARGLELKPEKIGALTRDQALAESDSKPDLEAERELRPVPMPDFTSQTAGQERAGEARDGFIQVGRTGIHRPPGAGAVSSLPVTPGYNITEAGQGISGEVAAQNAENAELRERRGMGVPGDEKGLTTITHTGRAKTGNDIVTEDVTVNNTTARAYALAKAEHDQLVASGKRDERVTPMPHPTHLVGGYHEGLVKVADNNQTDPATVERYAKKIGGKDYADVVAGLVGASIQAKNASKMEHIPAGHATRFIDPKTGENHGIEHLEKFPHIMAESTLHPKTGELAFMRAKGKTQVYGTNPETMESRPMGQYHVGWNVENIGGAPTLIKREPVPADHPMLRDLGSFIKQEMGSTTPMGSKSLESREAIADRASGLAGLQSGITRGRTRKKAAVAGIRETEPVTLPGSTPMESPVTPRAVQNPPSQTTVAGTTMYQAPQVPVVEKPSKPKRGTRQLQNAKLDAVGNPLPIPPVVGRRGDEPYYASSTAQTYNNPMATTEEEANTGSTMSQIISAVRQKRAASNFEGPKTTSGAGAQWTSVLQKATPRSRKITKKLVRLEGPQPKPVEKSSGLKTQYQGVLDFDNNLTDTDYSVDYDREKSIDVQTGNILRAGEESTPKVEKRANVSSQLLQAAQGIPQSIGTVRMGTQPVGRISSRPGSMWEEVRPQTESAAQEEEPMKIPTSAYRPNVPTSSSGTAGPVELYKPEVKGKTNRKGMAKQLKVEANEAQPLDFTRGDYREHSVPLGTAGPQGPKIRGTAGTEWKQPEIDFGMPTHEGGAQWLGHIQRSDSALVEKVRDTDRNWDYASSKPGRTASAVLNEGDFIHHKRFGGGKVVGTKVVEHPITKQPDLHVSVDFGGSTKGGMPNIKTLPLSEHGDLMGKVDAGDNPTALTEPSIGKTKADKKRYGKK